MTYASPTPPNLRAPWSVVVLNCALTAIALTALLAGTRMEGPSGTPAWVVVPLLVSLVIAGALRVRYRYGKEGEDLDVFEAVLAPVLLLYGVTASVAIVVVAKVVSETFARRQPMKAWFNVAQWAVAAAAGATVFGLVDGDGALHARTLGALVVAMVAVAVLNHSSLVIVLTLVQRSSVGQVLRDLRPAIVSGWLVGGAINIAFGLLVAAAAIGTVLVVPLFVIPLGVLHLASKHLAQERVSRNFRGAVQEAAAILSRPIDPRDAIENFLQLLVDVFACEAARLVLFADGASDVHHLSRADTPPYARWSSQPMPPLATSLPTAVALGPHHNEYSAMLEPGWRHCLVAPVRVEDRTIGLLYVLDSQGFAGDAEADLGALESMSGGAASSLARAEVVDRLAGVHRRSELLLIREAQVLESIANGEEIAASLDKVVAFVKAATPAASCTISTSRLLNVIDAADDRDPSEQRMDAPSSEDVVVGDGPALPAVVLHDLSLSLNDDRDVIVVPDVHQDVRWRQERDAWVGLHSCWLVPFTSSSAGGGVGCICVAHRDTRGVVGDAERLALAVAQRLAGMAAEQTVARDDLFYQATHDQLTGLANRAAFIQATNLATARSQRTGRKVGVLFVDLDHFKDVNDSMGHDAGDVLLIAVARRLQTLARSADTVARHGGDEFTILCEDLQSREDAEALGARFSSALRDPYVVNGVEVVITGTIGVALADRHSTATGLIEDADAAMYKAKARGRNRVEVFDECTRDTTHFRLTNQTELWHALEAGQFVVHYQPIRTLDALAMTGVEALVRRRATDGSLIGPDMFITLAEETGLIIPLGSFVLTQACQQAQLWRRDPSHGSLGVSVNVSARQISHGDLVQVVKCALEDSELPADALTLEITESTLVEVTESPATLRELRDLGVSIAIDDYGTGYSSLDYLRRLPIDGLKLDRVFLHEVATDHATEAIVSSTVKLANTLGLALVAEGIETDEQLTLLRNLGCPEGQGYYLGRPTDPRVLQFAPPVGVHVA